MTRPWMPWLLAILLLGPSLGAEVVIVDLGNTPPPSMVGPYPVTPADTSALAALPDGELTQTIPGFEYGMTLAIFPDVTKLTVPDSWASWGHGYRGPVLLMDQRRSRTSFFPDQMAAFYLYLRPRAGVATVEFSVRDQTTGRVILDASDGPRGFAAYSVDGVPLHMMHLVVHEGLSGVGVAQFGSADRTVNCEVGSVGLGELVHGVWTSDCGSRSDGRYYSQYLTFTLDEEATVEAELIADEGFPELLFRQGEGVAGVEIPLDRAGGIGATATAAVDLSAGAYTVEARRMTDWGEGPFTLKLYEIAGVCNQGRTELCIDDQPLDQRFKVEVDYATILGGGRSGAAMRGETNFERGGVFWFFDSDNPEIMIKVLNGCPVNGHYWIFVSAVTNVGFMVTVEDTATAETWTYENPDQHVAVPVQDVRAFACGALSG